MSTPKKKLDAMNTIAAALAPFDSAAREEILLLFPDDALEPSDDPVEEPEGDRTAQLVAALERAGGTAERTWLADELKITPQAAGVHIRRALDAGAIEARGRSVVRLVKKGGSRG